MRLMNSFSRLLVRKLSVILIGGLLFLLAPQFVGAHVISSGGAGHAGGVVPPIWRMALWVVLFVISACLAGAETAIT